MARKMLKDGDVPTADGEHYDYDLFVIGAGSGGVRGSRTAASFGAKVAICELPFHPISSEWLGGHGGTCVIRGCVPKKILVYGAQFRGEFDVADSNRLRLSGRTGGLAGPSADRAERTAARQDAPDRFSSLVDPLARRTGSGSGHCGEHTKHRTLLDSLLAPKTAVLILIEEGLHHLGMEALQGRLFFQAADKVLEIPVTQTAVAS